MSFKDDLFQLYASGRIPHRKKFAKMRGRTVLCESVRNLLVVAVA